MEHFNTNIKPIKVLKPLPAKWNKILCCRQNVKVEAGLIETTTFRVVRYPLVVLWGVGRYPPPHTSPPQHWGMGKGRSVSVLRQLGVEQHAVAPTPTLVSSQGRFTTILLQLFSIHQIFSLVDLFLNKSGRKFILWSVNTNFYKSFYIWKYGRTIFV